MMREGRNGGKLKTGGNNGGGRPPKLPQLDVLLDKVLGKDDGSGITAAEKILDALEKKAAKGDVRAAEVLLDRAYGKAKQSIDHNAKVEITTPPINWIKDEPTQ